MNYDIPPKGYLESQKEPVNWLNLRTSEEVEETLKRVVREAHMSSTAVSKMSTEEASQYLKGFIRDAGYPYGVSITVSEPNEAGQRMVMGMTNSPFNNEIIRF